MATALFFDGAVVDDALVVAAILAVQGYDAVKVQPLQGLHLPDHGDVPPGGQEGQNALFTQGLQGPDRGRGDAVGLVGKQGPIDVEKDGFEHGAASLWGFLYYRGRNGVMQEKAAVRWTAASACQKSTRRGDLWSPVDFA